MVRAQTSALKWLVLGTVGLLLFGWLLSVPPGLLGKADAIGYAVCHRISLRSFRLGDRVLPLCARCTGMHLGALLGLGYQSATSYRKTGTPPLRVLVILGVFAAAFAVDGVNSFASLIPGLPTLYQPQNWLRLLTGTGMGIGIAVMLLPAFNQTVWRDWQSGAAVNGMRSLAILVALAALLNLILLSENPLILYPLAILSALGVLLELTLVYTMIASMLLRIENRFQRLGEMILPLMGGFGLALAQIAFLDFLRYLLTGTWDGFHIG
jgi:uncharacterized membrane protein